MQQCWVIAVAIVVGLVLGVFGAAWSVSRANRAYNDEVWSGRAPATTSGSCAPVRVTWS